MGGNFPSGAILGGNCPVGSYLWREFSLGQIFWVGNVRGNDTGGSFPTTNIYLFFFSFFKLKISIKLENVRIFILKFDLRNHWPS